MEIATIVATSALFNWAAVEAWHHGSIFAKPRAWLEAHDPALWVELLQCPFCLSHWTALLPTLALMTYDDLHRPWWQWLALPVLSLAATRLSNVLNDVLHAYCRTVKPVDVGEEMTELAGIAEDTDGPTEPEA
jgi:hypothetical protein